MLEASGAITNRSQWLSALVNKAAQDAGVRQAVKQAIERKKEQLVELERLDAECDKVEVDKALLWEKLVEQFWARYTYTRKPTRQQNRYWLESRKKVLVLCRPTMSFEEVIDQLEQEGNSDGNKGILAQDSRKQAP